MTREIAESLRAILDRIAEDSGYRITQFGHEMDHVHLLIDCSPQHYIPDMLKALKGVSARLLMKEYGDGLRKKLLGGHLWNPSYFVATVSENTEEEIRKYILKQKER